MCSLWSGQVSPPQCSGLASSRAKASNPPIESANFPSSFTSHWMKSFPEAQSVAFPQSRRTRKRPSQSPFRSHWHLVGFWCLHPPQLSEGGVNSPRRPSNTQSSQEPLRSTEGRLQRLPQRQGPARRLRATGRTDRVSNVGPRLRLDMGRAVLAWGMKSEGSFGGSFWVFETF